MKISLQKTQLKQSLNKTLLTLAAALLMAAQSVQAVNNIGTGGTITYTDANGLNPVASPSYIGGYVVHRFTASGTLNLPASIAADFLVVGGGGGGGKFGGGGGAGGFSYNTSVTVAAGNTTVTVGAGGAGDTTAAGTGSQGSNSIFGTITAIGGGGGGSRSETSPFPGVNGAAGGCGGGGSASDTVATAGGAGTGGQGYAGGAVAWTTGSLWWGSGGGGGAGAAGSPGTRSGANNTSSGGNGGVGLSNSITGNSVFYAGGGGGATFTNATSGTAGVGGNGGGGAGGKNANGIAGAPNTGGGGGGGDISYSGAAGGSGIVIVRYPYVSGPDVTSPSIVTLSPADNDTAVISGDNLVTTFNENIALGSGSITIKNLSNSTQTVIPVGDPQISVAGAALTINPTANLTALKNYAIQIDAGAITDLSANPFVGIANDTNWNFTSATTPLRIMCLGDSITAGYTDNPTWSAAHSFMFGYRSGLYTRLTNAGYNFLLVGGSLEPWNNAYGDPSKGGTYKPTLDLRDFGQDGHRGYGGKTVTYLNSNILSWLASDNPDIILLKIGTNSQDQSGLNTLVNTITTTKPNCHLIIAQIMPKYSYAAGIVTYNTYIRDTLVPNYQALGKKVTLVDQYAPFLTNPAVLTSIDTSLFSNGINHPSNPGYDKMAQVWFNRIEALGVGPNTYSRWITGFPGVGALTGFHDDPDGDGKKNGLENFFGTSPSAATSGVIAGVKNGNTFTFTHPKNATPADDLNAVYRWSKDLSTFTAGGNSFEGCTVTFTLGSPSAGLVTVTATVTGTSLEKLFVDVLVRQN